MTCGDVHDGRSCQLPAWHVALGLRHRWEQWNPHPTYRATWCCTWRPGSLST